MKTKQVLDSKIGSEHPLAGSQSSDVLDTVMRVKTPENISFQYQIAGPFYRFFAYIIDILVSQGLYGLFVVLLYMLFVFIVIPLAARFGMGGLVTVIEVVGGILAGLVMVGSFIVYWFYGSFMETYYNGQTFGKRITKMRVISTDGHAIDGVQATLRNFFRLLDVMPFVSPTALFALEFSMPPMFPTFLFGLVIMTLSRKFQRLGDLVANTVVVNEEQYLQPNLATFQDERVPMLAELIPSSFVVSPAMGTALADYVDQRRFLSLARASKIASHLAAPLIEKFGIPADTDHDLFLCSLYYKAYIASTFGEEIETAPLTLLTNQVGNSAAQERALTPES